MSTTAQTATFENTTVLQRGLELLLKDQKSRFGTNYTCYVDKEFITISCPTDKNPEPIANTIISATGHLAFSTGSPFSNFHGPRNAETIFQNGKVVNMINWVKDVSSDKIIQDVSFDKIIQDGVNGFKIEEEMKKQDFPVTGKGVLAFLETNMIKMLDMKENEQAEAFKKFSRMLPYTILAKGEKIKYHRMVVGEMRQYSDSALVAFAVNECNVKYFLEFSKFEDGTWGLNGHVNDIQTSEMLKWFGKVDAYLAQFAAEIDKDPMCFLTLFERKHADKMFEVSLKEETVKKPLAIILTSYIAIKMLKERTERGEDLRLLVEDQLFISHQKESFDDYLMLWDKACATSTEAISEPAAKRICASV